MIERFNGRIAEVLATTRFDSAERLADTIKRYVKVYNQHIPQKALGHSPPLQAMKNWSQKQTQLFKKCAYNLAGLDRLGYSSSSRLALGHGQHTSLTRIFTCDGYKPLEV